LPGTESYDITKQAGELNAFQVTSIPALQIPEIPFGFKSMQNSGSRADNCYIPHDTATYTPLNRNDDESSAAIALPFTFNMYGTEYTSVFINNNGNITFNNPLFGYTAAGFPIPTPMIAPFWADVDTRPADSEVVWYKVTPTA